MSMNLLQLRKLDYILDEGFEWNIVNNYSKRIPDQIVLKEVLVFKLIFTSDLQSKFID